MTQPESKLSRAIMRALRDRGVFVFKVHGGPLMMAGLPDLIGCYQGRALAWETKVPGGKGPSLIQQRVHERMRAAGCVVTVPRSIADALAPLDAIDDKGTLAKNALESL